MNTQDLISEVAKRHGILLDVADPVLVTVTLNELVLSEYLRRAEEASIAAARRAEMLSERQLAASKQAAAELITRSAAFVANEVKAVIAQTNSQGPVTCGTSVPSGPGSTASLVLRGRTFALAIAAGVGAGLCIAAAAGQLLPVP